MKSEEILYTAEQVQEIVRKAVGENEARLRAEFEQTLTAKLSEQFEVFTKFNYDYIHQYMEKREWSYLS